MKTSILSLIATFAAAGLIVVSPVAAKNGNNGGNNGNKSNSSASRLVAQGIGIALSNSNHNGNNGNNGNHNGNHGSCNGGNGGYNDGGYNNSGYNNGTCNNGGMNGGYDGNGGIVNVENQTFPGKAYEPFHSTYVVLPGDSFYEISLKEYATSSNSKYIAQFNNLPQTAALTPGQVLRLPSISATRQLSASRAPAAESLQNTANSSQTTSNSASSETSSAANEAPRPKVNVGATLLVDGQTFGDKQGAARLRVGGAALKIEVLEWKADAVKIRLPELALDSTANADIEIVRADNTLASKTGIELSTAADVVAAQ
jgi:LysM repeat protein